jgi:gas vesicle protein
MFFVGALVGFIIGAAAGIRLWDWLVVPKVN